MENRYNVVSTRRTVLGRFSIRLDIVEKEGSGYPYSFIEAKNSVAVLARMDDRFVLIRQYRHSIQKYILEIPGGSIENGEVPKQAAKREFLEETGYEAENIIPLGSFYPTAGSSSERCWLYYAECGSKSGQRLDPLESLIVELVQEKELEYKIMKGEFVHGAGLAAWLKYKLTVEGRNVDRKNQG